jgi:hypothetical protein
MSRPKPVDFESDDRKLRYLRGTELFPRLHARSWSRSIRRSGWRRVPVAMSSIGPASAEK